MTEMGFDSQHEPRLDFKRNDVINPADIAASGLASPAMEVSLLGMFWSAHFVVKLVMLGLLCASVWCWAIIINKILLFSKTQRAMAQFEDVFWSGASLHKLYYDLIVAPGVGHGGLVCRGDAGMAAFGARRGLVLHGPAGAHRESPRRFDRPRS